MWITRFGQHKWRWIYMVFTFFLNIFLSFNFFQLQSTFNIFCISFRYTHSGYTSHIFYKVIPLIWVLMSPFGSLITISWLIYAHFNKLWVQSYWYKLALSWTLLIRIYNLEYFGIIEVLPICLNPKDDLGWHILLSYFLLSCVTYL